MNAVCVTHHSTLTSPRFGTFLLRKLSSDVPLFRSSDIDTDVLALRYIKAQMLMATLEGEAKGRDKELVSDGQEMRPDWQYLMSECPLLTEFAISSQQ